MKILKKVAYVLLIVGGLNWGLVGLFDFNLVDQIFGDMTMISRVVYALVGVSAVCVAVTLSKCRGCDCTNKCCQ